METISSIKDKTIEVARDKTIELIVGGILVPILTYLYTLLTQKIKLSIGSNVSDKLDSLCKRAIRINARLHDAEQNRRIEDVSVLLWLSELRSIGSQIDDLKDDFETRSRLQSSSCPVRGFWSYTWYYFFWGVWGFWSYSRYCWCVQNRMKKINKNFDRLYEDRQGTMLHGCEAARIVQSSRFRESGSLEPRVNRFHGRFSEKRDLVDLLLQASNNFSVISINGVGGIGKTALAQSVFADGRITDRFDLRIWLSLSSQPDSAKTLQKMLTSIEQTECNLSNLDTLQTSLQNQLKNKKVLLVLDGLWTEDPLFWDTIRVTLNLAEKETKILVTSHNQVASQYIGMSESILLSTLDTHSLWLVLMDNAFPKACQQDFSGVSENLREIGRQIVNKCDGSPLAAKLLGKILCNCYDETDWMNLLTDMPNPTDVVQQILPSLKLTYEVLPLHLKRCFAYCSIFPKNYEFDRDDLVKLWLSEGLLSKSIPANKIPENVGRDQFNYLLKRSFFQPSDGCLTKYVMPGAIHDLAQSVSEYECLRVGHSGIQHGNTEHKHAIYALLVGSGDSVNHIYERKSIRTLILFNESRIVTRCVECVSLVQLVKELRCLRSLDLSCKKIKNLPSSIKNLIHLRYLNLRGSLFETLPDSICDLLNLQTLELGECCKLKKLPKGLNKLINIRHIGLGLNWEKWDGQDFDSMPPCLGQLTKLQTLSRFSVSKGDESRITELQNLDLRGELCISKLENVKDVNEAKEVKLNEKNDLEFLMLKGSEGKGFNKDVLESLKPVETIKSIFIEGYNDSTFPDWIKDPSFNKLETIGVFKCKECVALHELGELGHLRSLHIRGFDRVADLDNLLRGPNGSVEFQSLEKLYISDMPELKTCGVLEDRSIVIKSTNCSKWETTGSSNNVASPQSSTPALGTTPTVGTTWSGVMNWIRRLR